ncbi:acetyltransferase, putative [Plasmodium sp. gorilla clade G3]|nr:acetyltransferase, putative [Plasmodium sp. gorilla clade G3]
MNDEAVSEQDEINNKVENYTNPFVLADISDLDFEKSIGKSFECNTTISEFYNESLPKKDVYHTMFLDEKEIDIYQYRTFPKNYLNSMYNLLSTELSEPYNIFLLKTVLNDYGEIALMSIYEEQCVGAVISKITTKCKNDETITFGYICMIAVHKSIRSLGLGSYLLNESIKLMQNIYGINEIHLEAEATNYPTLRFYEKNGFIRVKRKPYYYLSGVDAFKLKKIL